jgi:hypothetical protein
MKQNDSDWKKYEDLLQRLRENDKKTEDAMKKQNENDCKKKETDLMRPDERQKQREMSPSNVSSIDWQKDLTLFFQL